MPQIIAAMQDDHKFLTDRADRLFRYNGMFWEEISTAQLRALILRYDPIGQSTDRRRREIRELLRGTSYYEGLEWGRVADNEVACRNGVFDVTVGRLRPHNPDDFLERVLPWDYRPGASCELWEAAVERCLGDARELKLGLQEFFGYAIMSHARFKKALVLEGKPDTGKSAIVTVLRELVGMKHICSLGVQFMDDPQKRAVLIGKALNLVSELTSDAMVADGGFRQLVSTEEAVLIDPKYQDPFAYVPTTKHVFAMNELPTINDRSEATLNRLLVIVFRRVLASTEQDRGFEAKLVAQMHGILLWAIEGARRLIAQDGRFTVSAEASARIAELRGDVNPIFDFLTECCRPDAGSAVPLAVLTRQYNLWNPRKRVGPREVGRMLRQAGLTVKSVRHGKRSANSLVGYIVEYEALPDRFNVDKRAATSPEQVIEAQPDRRRGR